MMLMMLVLGKAAYWRSGQMMLMMLALGLAAYWRAFANDAHAACP